MVALDFTSAPRAACIVDGRITALAPVRNALAVAYRSSASLKYPGAGNPVTFLTWTKLENGEVTLSETRSHVDRSFRGEFHRGRQESDSARRIV
jgi:hypothetical protein